MHSRRKVRTSIFARWGNPLATDFPLKTCGKFKSRTHTKKEEFWTRLAKTQIRKNEYLSFLKKENVEKKF